MAQRHIAVLTGKRGGFGAMKPMLSAIDKDPDLKLSLIVTDQHINPLFGATIAEIERDFKVSAAVDMGQTGDSAVERVKALGTCLIGMAQALSRLAPDILVLYGDRGEVLATAIAALNLGIPIAHIQGGDVSGNIDECMRHAITKLSHIHFSSTQESAGRIKTMGEEAWRIFIVGDNHVDPIVSKDYSDAKTVRAKFAIPDFEKPILVLIHPETFRIRDGYGDAKCVLEPVLELGRRTILVYPCSDQGYEAIVRALEEVAHYPNVSLHKNIDTPDFHGLMAISSFLIGNSSAGLIEAPYFPLPAIDVGERQIGRMRAENVIHCDFDRTEIIQSLDIVLNNDVFARRMANCSRPFGDGKAYMSIVEHLKTTPLGTALIQKKFASL